MKLRKVYEAPGITKGVNAVAYNKGGNYLAAGLGSWIYIYDPYNFEVINKIRAH